MISFLEGKPLIHQKQLTILVGGVGYGVSVGSKVFYVAASSDLISLFIYSHIREDAFDLYGFLTKQELDLFKLVLSVSGVGPKTALPMIDAGASELVSSVQNADITFFTQIPRVGKKLAQKIIIDLKSKLGSLKDLDLKPLSSEAQDILEALMSLGFDETSSREAIKQVPFQDQKIEISIKQAIRLLR